jgi:hypothetical protein
MVSGRFHVKEAYKATSDAAIHNTCDCKVVHAPQPRCENL